MKESLVTIALATLLIAGLCLAFIPKTDYKYEYEKTIDEIDTLNATIEDKDDLIYSLIDSIEILNGELWEYEATPEEKAGYNALLDSIKTSILKTNRNED